MLYFTFLIVSSYVKVINLGLIFTNIIKYYNSYVVLFTLYLSIIFIFINYAVQVLYISNTNFIVFNNAFLSFNVFFFPFFYIFFLITFVSLAYCLSYNFSEVNSFLIYILIIFLSGMGLFLTDSFIYFLIFYEFLLVPSFIILYKYSKTRRSVEAAYLMFFWTQFGAIFLIFILFYIFLLTNSTLFSNLFFFKFTKFEINFIFFFFLMGFGVKLPIWPFYDWLPKAHVEASTNFSIFLSGVLVKFAFFGFFKALISLEAEPTFAFVLPYLFIGLFDSIFKVFYQIDAKKLVAFCTVAEMHWLLIAILSGQTFMWLSGFSMLISHAVISTNSFLMVDSIARRFKTRLITEISGINFFTPKLFILILINSLVFLGFPGTLFFIAEFVFFTFLFDMMPLLSILLMTLLYLFLATFFLRLWMNILFGSIVYYKNSIVLDSDKTEVLIFSFFIFIMFWLGSTWQSFIF